MVNNKFVADYQINTSRKILFPYLSTASGLSEWFADDVSIDEDKNFIFHYDGEDHYAKVVALRPNMHVKFDFYDPQDSEHINHSYLEFKIEENELTQTIFLKVVDNSDAYEDDELIPIWDSLISSLKEIIGG